MSYVNFGVDLYDTLLLAYIAYCMIWYCIKPNRKPHSVPSTPTGQSAPSQASEGLGRQSSPCFHHDSYHQRHEQ